jgi:hypothetical protein
MRALGIPPVWVPDRRDVEKHRERIGAPLVFHDRFERCPKERYIKALLAVYLFGGSELPRII